MNLSEPFHWPWPDDGDDDRVLRRLRHLAEQGHNIQQLLKELRLDISRLTDDVAAQKTVIDSASTLLSTLAQEIRDNANDPAALGALADSLESNTQALSDAVQANTPAPPAPPADATPPDAAPPDAAPVDPAPADVAGEQVSRPDGS